MNRKIKFRALSEISKSPKWVYGTGVIQVEENTYKTDDWEMVISVNYDELDYFIPSYYTEEIKINTLGQFTGLYDKNGVEIYEGDIITFESGSGGREICLIYYDEQLLSLNMKWYPKGYIYDGLSYLRRKEKIEVIGNIYESEVTNDNYN